MVDHEVFRDNRRQGEQRVARICQQRERLWTEYFNHELRIIQPIINNLVKKSTAEQTQIPEAERRRILLDSARQVRPAIFFSLVIIVVSFLPALNAAPTNVTGPPYQAVCDAKIPRHVYPIRICLISSKIPSEWDAISV
jgi:hypothetical protein